ncbi:amidohydrolase family protein [Planctomycetota bacterium]
MKPQIESDLVHEFIETGKSADCPVIDTHGHMGPFAGIYFPNASAERMVATLEKCGIRKLFFAHHHAMRDSAVGNLEAEAAIAAFPEQLGGYWAVTPLYPERVKQEVAEFPRHAGFAGFKILAAYYNVPITDPRCAPVWEYAHEDKRPVLVHTWGGDPCAGCPQIAAIAKRYPQARILMGHAQYGDWDAGIEVAKKFPNVYLELTAAYHVSGSIDKMVAGGAQDKIVYGEDLPWFDPMYGIGAVLFADISDEARHAILHTNAERIFERWL